MSPQIKSLNSELPWIKSSNRFIFHKKFHSCCTSPQYVHWYQRHTKYFATAELGQFLNKVQQHKQKFPQKTKEPASKNTFSVLSIYQAGISFRPHIPGRKSVSVSVSTTLVSGSESVKIKSDYFFATINVVFARNDLSVRRLVSTFHKGKGVTKITSFYQMLLLPPQAKPHYEGCPISGVGSIRSFVT